MKHAVRVLVGALLGFVVMTPTASAVNLLSAGVDNDVFFTNVENLFDATGRQLPPLTPPAPGMYLAGILNIQNVDAPPGSDFFNSGPGGEVSGVFAQLLTGVVPLGGGVFGLTFGNPVVTTFYKDTNLNGVWEPGLGEDGFVTGLAPGGEMFGFYEDDPAVSLYESNGTMADDVTKATDDSLLLTLGISIPTDSVTGFVTLVPGPFCPAPPCGVQFGALSVLQNNTGFSFAPVFFEGLLGDVVYTSQFGPRPVGSWDFESEDPARIHPESVIPEASSLWLLGMGLSSLGFTRRRRFLI